MASAMLLSFTAGAVVLKPTSTVLLYPEGQGSDAKGIFEDGIQITLGPSENNELTGGMKSDMNGRLSNIGDDVCMDLYIPRKCNGLMVVICPGGGYTIVSSVSEGSNVAEWFYKRNVAACVLKYRLPNGHSTVPLTDVQNAFRYCRHHAAAWGVRKIGVIGFSAGGHLAASASTLYTDAATKPDFSILIYPVINLDSEIAHMGTKKQLVGEDAELAEKYSLEKRVNGDSPRTLIMLSSDDKAVKPENSLRYYNSLVSYKVPVELHSFATGGHGYGFYKQQLFGGKKDPLGKGQRKAFEDTLERFLDELD